MGKYFDTPDHPARLPERLEDWRQARPSAGQPLVVDAPDSRLEVERVTTAAGAAETTLLVLRERRSGISPDALRSLGLTKREGEVLDLVARGQTDQQIAHELVISPRTVQKHLQHIYEKLGVPSRTAAVSRALLH
jgi:DNA-binding NarL/FixJ family response regulator